MRACSVTGTRAWTEASLWARQRPWVLVRGLVTFALAFSWNTDAKIFCVSEFPQELVGGSGMILLEPGAWQTSFRDTQLGNSQRPAVVG